MADDGKRAPIARPGGNVVRDTAYEESEAVSVLGEGDDLLCFLTPG
jgi:hypothetical protein